MLNIAVNSMPIHHFCNGKHFKISIIRKIVNLSLLAKLVALANVKMFQVRILPM